MAAISDDPLLQPFTLKHLTLRNRVFSSSHEPAYSENGMPKERYRLYHVEKAKGGIGLTMTAGSAVVAEDSPPAFGNLHAYDDAIVPWIRQMTDEVHEHGAACMIQLTHLGRRTGWDHDDWLPVVAPSPLREPAHRAHPKEAEEWDIDRIVGQVRRRGRADAGRRHGRRRGRVLRAPRRPVLVTAHEPAHRRIRRFVGEPPALRPARARRDPGADRPRVRGRRPHGGRRDGPGRHRRRDRARDPRPVGGRRTDRFRERHSRVHRRRPEAARGHPDPRDAVGSAPRLRRPGPGGHRARRAARVEGRRRGHRPARDPRGQGRPRRHDPGPPRRSPHRAQDPRRSGARDPTLRRRHVLSRPHLRVGRSALHPQRGDEP